MRLPAARRRGPRSPAPRTADRAAASRSIVADAGFRYFFVDSHLAAGGTGLPALWSSGGSTRELGETAEALAVPGLPRRRAARGATPVCDPGARPGLPPARSGAGRRAIPATSGISSSTRSAGPADSSFWRVSAAGADLGAKQPYDPSRASSGPGSAQHSSHLLGRSARRAIAADKGSRRRADLIAVPFDTELFGHWWFEGVDFIARCVSPAGGTERYSAVHRLRDRLRPSPAAPRAAPRDRLVGRQRRLQHVAQRRRPNGPGAACGPSRRHSGKRPPRP